MKPRSELLPVIALLGVLGLVALMVVRSPVPPEPQPGPMSVSGGDYKALSYTVSRIFGARVLAKDTNGRSQLLVGELPPDLPFELPIPPGTTVVGSLAGELSSTAEIVMDSNTPPDDLFREYQESFTAQGFVEQVYPAEAFGIEPADQVIEGHSSSFCRSRDSVMVSLGITPKSGQPTRVWMYANWRPQSVSCLSYGVNGFVSVAEGFLPKLKTPKGSVVHEFGSGSSAQDGNAYEEVQVEYPTTAANLSEYLTPQLEAAGWTQTGATSSEYGAWSTWQFVDAEGHTWLGALVIVTSPISNQFSVRVEIRKEAR